MYTRSIAPSNIPKGMRSAYTYTYRYQNLYILFLEFGKYDVQNLLDENKYINVFFCA